jgi:pimeloyl-ACP methyl ester carboxylesterase
MPLRHAPSLALLGIEPLRFVMEYAACKLMDRHALPAGDGHPVVLFPGLAADPRAMAPLARCCEQLGYSVHDWGRGFNTGPQGDVDEWLDALTAGVREIVEREGRSASLIGWSLGGIYAREIARLRPELARQVITLGTPFAGHPEHTHAGWVYRLLSGRKPELDRALRRRLRSAPPVPTTSIYSRTDGVVPWRACLQSRARRAENIEVDGSHIGLACHPKVLRIVADRLAQPEGRWRPAAATRR